MSERKVILKIILIALLGLTTFCPAVALASPSDRPAITVLHPSQARSFIVGKNLFKFQHFATEENAEVKTLATADALVHIWGQISVGANLLVLQWCVRYTRLLLTSRLAKLSTRLN